MIVVCLLLNIISELRWTVLPQNFDWFLVQKEWCSLEWSLGGTCLQSHQSYAL